MSGRTRLMLMLWIGLSTAVSSAMGVQESYKADPIDPAFVMPDASKYDTSKKEQKTELANLRNGVKAALATSDEVAQNIRKGSADINSARTEFDRYYNGYALPSMTQTDDDSLSKLGDMRKEILGQIAQTANDSAVRKHLSEELVLPYFSRIASDTAYHPAVRLNAVVILGNLNRREGQRDLEPPLPMESALRVLLNVVSAADTPPYLKISALSGVLRHANIDGQLPQSVMDNALREQAITMAVGILDATAPADGVSISDEQYWMRRQAVQILGGFRALGADNKAVTSLRKVLDDPATPLWLAADAIEAYGNLKFTAPEQADVANVVKSIGGIVSKFFKADIQSIDDYVSAIRENRMIARRSTDDSKEKSDAGAAPDESGAASGSLQGKGNAGEKAGGLTQTVGVTAPVIVPNYKINDVRTRTKSIVFIARRALDGLAPKRKNEQKNPENLKKFADPATQKIIEQMVAALDKVMEETDLTQPKAPAAASQVAKGEAPKKPETNDERLRNTLKFGISAVESATGAAPVEQQPVIKSAVGG